MHVETAVDVAAPSSVDDITYLADIAADPELDRAVLDRLAEPVIVVDEQRRIVRVNQKAELFLGYGKLELLGQPIEVLVPELKRKIHAEVHTERYMKFPQSRQMGSRLSGLAVRTKAGSEIGVTISLEPFLISRGRFVNAVIRLLDEVRG